MHSYFIVDLLSRAQAQITPEDYYSYKNDVKNIGILWQIEDLFTLLANAFVEFEETLVNTALRDAYCHSEGHDLHAQFNDNRQAINLKTISILTAARIYEEQILQLSPKRHLPNEQAIDLKSLFSKEFDEHLEYRVMYALRNYALHSRPPIAAIYYDTKNLSETGRITDGSPTYCQHSVSPRISAKEFIKSDKIKVETRKEVEELNCEYLDAKFFVRGYISCLYNIHETVRKQTQELFENCVENLKHVEEKLKTLNNQTDKIPQMEKRQDGRRIEEYTISHENNLRLRSVRKYWSGFGSLQRRHVSSIITSNKDTYPKNHDKIWIPK